MAIIQAVFAALARSAGKLLNMVFGWATVNLFGKVPEDRQKYLSVIAFGSVIWLVVVVGIIVPRVGVFLLSFVPTPDWVNDNIIRLAMLAAALLVPLVVGFVATKLQDEEHRQKNIWRALLKGYPYTLAVALALLMMLVFAPVMRLRAVVKRWQTEHLPVIVEEDHYLEIVSEIEKALDNAGIAVDRQPAAWMLRLPLKVLTALAGKGSRNLVADNLTLLKASGLEIVLHPADLALTGQKQLVARAQAVTVEQLAFAHAYMTWTKEGNDMEDRLRRMWEELKGQRPRLVQPHLIGDLQRFEEDLRRTKLEYDEWTVLFREKLMVERSLWQMQAGAAREPLEPASARGAKTGAHQPRRSRKASIAGPIAAASVVGVLVFAAGSGVTKLFSPRKREPCDDAQSGRGA